MIEPLEEEPDNKNKTKTKKIISDINSNKKLIYISYLIILIIIIFFFI